MNWKAEQETWLFKHEVNENVYIFLPYDIHVFSYPCHMGYVTGFICDKSIRIRVSKKKKTGHLVYEQIRWL